MIMKPRISNQKNQALTITEVLVSVVVVLVLAGIAYLIFHHAKSARENVRHNRSSEIQNALQNQPSENQNVSQNQSSENQNVPQSQSSEIQCVNNLKQIGLAFRIWEGDNRDKYPMQISARWGGAMEPAAQGNVAPIFRVMSNELSTPKVLVCPADADRSPANRFTTGFDNSHVSYFVGLDANDRFPQTLLSGDANMAVDDVPVKTGLLHLSAPDSVTWTSARHAKEQGNVGNIGLADGSVQTASSSFLQQMLRQSGATNRLAIP